MVSRFWKGFEAIGSLRKKQFHNIQGRVNNMRSKGCTASDALTVSEVLLWHLDRMNDDFGWRTQAIAEEVDRMDLLYNYVNTVSPIIITLMLEAKEKRASKEEIAKMKRDIIELNKMRVNLEKSVKDREKKIKEDEEIVKQRNKEDEQRLKRLDYLK